MTSTEGFAGFCRTTKEDEDADRQFEKSVREHARLLRHDDGGPIQDQDAHTGDRQQHKQQHHQLADDGRLRAGSDESVRTQERGRGLALLDTGDLADAMADAADTPGGSMENGGSWALPRSSPQGLVSSAGTFTKGLERIANNNMQPPATNRSAAGVPAQQDEYLMRLLRGTPSGSRCTTSLQQNHTGQGTISGSAQQSQGGRNGMSISFSHGVSHGGAPTASGTPQGGQGLDVGVYAGSRGSELLGTPMPLPVSMQGSRYRHGDQDRATSGHQSQLRLLPEQQRQHPAELRMQQQSLDHHQPQQQQQQPPESTVRRTIIQQKAPRTCPGSAAEGGAPPVCLPPVLKPLPAALQQPHKHSPPQPQQQTAAHASPQTPQQVLQPSPQQQQRQQAGAAPRPPRRVTGVAAEAQRQLGAAAFEAVRATMLRQQDIFTQQLYGLHCAVRRQAQQVAACEEPRAYAAALQQEQAKAGSKPAAAAVQGPVPPVHAPAIAAQQGFRALQPLAVAASHGAHPGVTAAPAPLFALSGAPPAGLAHPMVPAPLQEQAHLMQQQALLLQQQQTAQHQMFLLQQAQLRAAAGGAVAYPSGPAAAFDPMAAWYAQHFTTGGAMAPAAASMHAAGLQASGYSVVPAVVQQMAAQQGRVPPPPQPPLQDIPAAAAATDATPAAPAGGAAVGAAVPPPPQGGKPFSAFPHTPAALPSALGSGPGAAPALLAAPSLAAQAQQQNLSVLAGGGLPMYPSCGTDGSSRQPTRWWQDASATFGPAMAVPALDNASAFYGTLHPGAPVPLLMSMPVAPGGVRPVEGWGGNARKRSRSQGAGAAGEESIRAPPVPAAPAATAQSPSARRATVKGQRSTAAGRGTGRSMGRKRPTTATSNGATSKASADRSPRYGDQYMADSPPAQLTSAADILLSFSECG
mmetsp:Transcript_7303/g.21535  ORF Transcript_7303/g.21535 Transcript_7303/m.21535 type:complete len:918 (+) Transcript_7303:2012-4765(+)